MWLAFLFVQFPYSTPGTLHYLLCHVLGKAHSQAQYEDSHWPCPSLVALNAARVGPTLVFLMC